MFKTTALALLLCCAGMAFFGCGEERNFHVPASAFDADVPEPVDVRAVMALGDFDAWQSATGAFGYAYTEDILRIGAGDDPATVAEFETFLTHPNVAPIEAAIDSTSGAPERLAQSETELIRAFQRFHHWFPEAQLPQLMWMNTGFNYAVYPTDEHLGVGLEWYLGADHPIVSTLPPEMFPQYMRNRMEPNRISASAFRGWLLVHFSDPWYRTTGAWTNCSTGARSCTSWNSACPTRPKRTCWTGRLKPGLGQRPTNATSGWSCSPKMRCSIPTARSLANGSTKVLSPVTGPFPGQPRPARRVHGMAHGQRFHGQAS